MLANVIGPARSLCNTVAAISSTASPYDCPAISVVRTRPPPIFVVPPAFVVTLASGRTPPTAPPNVVRPVELTVSEKRGFTSITDTLAPSLLTT